MRPIIIICIVLYALSMEAVHYGAHQFVGTFGALAGFALIAGTYLTARHFERRR